MHAIANELLVSRANTKAVIIVKGVYSGHELSEPVPSNSEEYQVYSLGYVSSL